MKIEIEREADGRWIAEVVDARGAMAYGPTPEAACSAAVDLAFEVMAANRALFPRLLAVVTLSRPIVADGVELPAGAIGTVVHAYPGGLAYEVEFQSPRHALATVELGDIEPPAAA